jgi:hypothetical protein
VGTVTLRVPFPKGYCVPQGDRAAHFEQLAAPDHRNVTLLSLVDCHRDPKSNRYLLIKTPVAALDLPLNRADTIKEMSQVFVEPDFAAEMKSMPDKVGADKSAETGVQTELVGKYEPRGHDDVCVYLGGPMSTTRNGKTQKQVAGSCMTVVGNRMLVLHAYENSNDPQAYKNLLPKLKLWALRIKPASHR